MTATIPTTEPTEFRRGDTVKFTISLPDYLPADGWTLRYAFVRNGKEAINVDGTDNGDRTHLITIPPTGDPKSEDFDAELWYYQGTVDNGTDYHTLPQHSGRVQVLEKFTDVSGTYDPRSQTKKDLDLVQALIDGKLAAGDVASYSIANRSLNKYTGSELYALRDRLRNEYEAELDNERITQGRRSHRKHRARFIR